MRANHSPNAVQMSGPYVMLGCYVPALWIVLRRANIGEVPGWVERMADSLPTVIRGLRVVPREVSIKR